MTNDDKDLKPCPFCGDTKYLRVTYQDSKANASITGDKKYWGVFCMEKCGASIDSIYPTREEAIRVWNTRATPQQPSEPMKELDFKPNGYDMDGNPIQYGFSGGSQQPSENKALSLDSIKTILTKIMKKELVDIGEHFCFVCGEPMSEEKRGLLIDYIAQAIHSALPAQREVSESCGCCGSKMVYIRGKFPKEDNRLICPCCAYERLEQINDISNKDYGKSYQTGEMKKLNGG